MINFYAEKPFPVEAPDNMCEFVLEIRDAVDGSFDAKLYYSSDLYNLDTAERFSGHFRVLMKGVSSKLPRLMDLFGILILDVYVRLWIHRLYQWMRWYC